MEGMKRHEPVSVFDFGSGDEQQLVVVELCCSGEVEVAALERSEWRKQ